MRRPSSQSVLFTTIVLLCVAQLCWWVIFQIGEAQRLQRAGDLVAAGATTEALQELGADREGGLGETARRRRLMFLWEGATLGVLVIAGFFVFYATVLRDQRRRESQDRFLAGATHELQTPLATVRLGIESLLVGSLPSEQRVSYLHGMLREVSRLESGIRNILTAAGLTRATIRPVLGDLAEDLRAAVAVHATRAETADITIRITTTEPCPVQRDSEGIRLVLHNLIDNAIKYSTAGDTVQVSALVREQEAQVLVEDEGAGIRPEDLDSIFERFTRGAADHTGHIGGSGLGLYLVREIVHAHSGRVSVSSAGPGCGSCFVVSLPLAGEAA